MVSKVSKFSKFDANMEISYKYIILRETEVYVELHQRIKFIWLGMTVNDKWFIQQEHIYNKWLRLIQEKETIKWMDVGVIAVRIQFFVLNYAFYSSINFNYHSIYYLSISLNYIELDSVSNSYMI